MPCGSLPKNPWQPRGRSSRPTLRGAGMQDGGALACQRAGRGSGTARLRLRGRQVQRVAGPLERGGDAVGGLPDPLFAAEGLDLAALPPEPPGLPPDTGHRTRGLAVADQAAVQDLQDLAAVALAFMRRAERDRDVTAAQLHTEPAQLIAEPFEFEFAGSVPFTPHDTRHPVPPS